MAAKTTLLFLFKEWRVRIIYTDLDGGLSVVMPSPEWTGSMDELALKVVPAGLDYRIVDESLLPGNREFRNAWTDEYPGSQVDIDAIKAKNLQLSRLRQERNAKLSALDIEVMRAQDKDDQESLARIRGEKEVLRDATEPLKNLAVSGPATDNILDQIRALGTLSSD